MNQAMVINHKENPFAPSGSTIDFEDSSNLDSGVYYSTASGGVLEVKFKSGQWYRYLHIPPALMNAMWQGRPTKDGSNRWSRGAAFYQLVRSMPHLYPYQKIGDEQVGELAG